MDLVISDVGLPDGTGLELMRRLSSSGPLPGIALSGYGMDFDIEQSKKAGFARHLTKPITTPLLFKAIAELTAVR
jgi:CheY-like chemotaxis protein